MSAKKERLNKSSSTESVNLNELTLEKIEEYL
mgnify:CR=1 FL=1